jgi:hypothetical protein
MKPLTMEQALALQYGNIIFHRFWTNADKKTPQRFKVNGNVKTWKTRPGEIRIPLKRAMYEFMNMTEANLSDFSLEAEEHEDES